MKNLFLLLVVTGFSLQANAQSDLDSLYTVWQDKTMADSTRAMAFKNYVWNGFLFSNPDSAFVLAETLHVFANDQQYRKAAALAFNLQGIANYMKGNYPNALDFNERSMAVWEEIGDKNGISNSLNNIGIIHDEQGHYPRALEYYEKSLALREEIGNRRGIAASLGNIGVVYQTQGNNPRAMEYAVRSLAIQEETGDKPGMANSLTTIGIIYNEQDNYPRALEYYERSLALEEEIGNNQGISRGLHNIGTILQKQGKNSEALEYYEKSLAIDEELGDKLSVGICLSSIGRIFQSKGNNSRALEYFTRSLALQEEIGNKPGIAISLYDIGRIHLTQGNNARALTYCKDALVLSEELEALTLQKSACECLYTTYKNMGNGNEALEYMEKMNAIDKSLHSEETAKKLQQMEFAKQVLADSIASAEEARLVEQAHQEEVRQKIRIRNIFGGVGFFALLLAGGFFWRWRYVQQSKVTLQVEKDRSENLLLNILPADIAAELKEKGRADARDFEMVSILFTDFKGFTAASEKLSAQDLVSEINTCFEAFDGIMGKYNVEKIKTIGDAYMAAGGLPVPTDDSVKNTVLAALEMQDFIRDRKAKLDTDGKPGFEMRVGVHTGPVVAGIVGVKKFQYDIWGDTVNTASRMESSGEVGKVNISEATYDLLKDDTQFSFESRGKIEAKGKGEMEMFFVEAV